MSDDYFDNSSSYRTIDHTNESANEGGGYSFVFHDKAQEEEEEKKKKKDFIKNPVVVNLSSQSVSEKKSENDKLPKDKVKHINIMA